VPLDSGIDNGFALNTAQLLSEEFSQICTEQKPQQFASEAEYQSAMHGRDQAALCLSGGGIRSASFAVGVVQALARKGILTQFHYLSTVSGGGYTGGWLCRWISECGVKEVAAALSDPKEPPQLRALREGSNFLTPRLGIASRDTWAVIVIFVRNILLNWLIFGPALFLLALIPNFYVAVMYFWAALMKSWAGPPLNKAWWEWENLYNHLPVIITLSVSAAFLMLSVRAAWLHLPSHRNTKNQKRRNSVGLENRALIECVVLPSLVWAFLMPVALGLELEEGLSVTFYYALVVTFVAKLVGYGLAWFSLEGTDKERLQKNWLVWLWCSGTSSLAFAVAVWLVQLISPNWGDSNSASEPGSLAVFAIIGPSLVTLSQLILSAQFAALGRLAPDFGYVSPDLDREWLARLSAAKIVPTLAWAVLAIACLLLPHLFLVSSQWLGHAVITATTVISGAVAVLGGATAKSALNFVRSKLGKSPKLLANVILAIATVVFVAALFMILSRLEFLAAGWISANFFTVDDACLSLVFAHTTLAIVAAFLVGIGSIEIDVNRFSLHGLYRNRLAKAFLGAGRTPRNRAADPFTGFDPRDNVRMCQLAGFRVLFPVVNVALNLVGGDRLAWQERKAEAFVITPIACGSAMLHISKRSRSSGYLRDMLRRVKETIGRMMGRPGTESRPVTRTPETTRDGAYCRSNSYGDDERDKELGGKGISLATAMTISGAAASPSMGYHSSPTTSFLMTLFNVRLGAWLANPSCATKSDLQRAGPSFALRPLLREMLGLTNDRGTDIYLSDGGHFENLGLYEMVRRRCRFIVVIDAGCDPECHFEDLGNAVRKIFIDQNVRITIEPKNIFARTKLGENPAAFALGKIKYPEQPNAKGDWDLGDLLYIKPSYFPPVPADLRAYAQANGLFPHESTADQWFSESQFESYRRLGEFLVENIGKDKPYESIKEFFEELLPKDGTSAALECEHHLPQSSSASRRTASQAGFLHLSQSDERPLR